jgi:hypothetical protein
MFLAIASGRIGDADAGVRVARPPATREAVGGFSRDEGRAMAVVSLPRWRDIEAADAAIASSTSYASVAARRGGAPHP